jgi:hypothetical protein
MPVRWRPPGICENLARAIKDNRSRYMTKEVAGRTAAALGVILSLLFVGLEIRQNNTIAQASAMNELASNQRE